MKNLLLLLLFVHFTSFTFIKEEEDKINWTKEYKLTWSDFKGKPDKASKNFAATNSGFGFETNGATTEGCTFIVTNSFYRKTSWVKKDKANEPLLAHEQCHFDITELCTRKFRKKLSAIKYNPKTMQKTTADLFRSEQTNWAKMQDQYDRETQHSIITAKQEEWEKKVAKELEELNDFTNSSIKLTK